MSTSSLSSTSSFVSVNLDPPSVASSSSSSAPLPNLEARIKTIREKCDEMRKQSPCAHFSLYQGGFVVSVISGIMGIVFRSYIVLAISLMLGKIFWSTISRANERIQCIDGLEKAEEAKERLLDCVAEPRKQLQACKTELESLQRKLIESTMEGADEVKLKEICNNITLQIPVLECLVSDASRKSPSQNLKYLKSLISLGLGDDKTNSIRFMKLLISELTKLDNQISIFIDSSTIDVVRQKEAVNTLDSLMNRG